MLILRLEVRIWSTYYSVMCAEPQSGSKSFLSTLKSFDVEFLPFIEEINAKEEVIREYADAATMERIRRMLPSFILFCSVFFSFSSFHHIILEKTAGERYNYVRYHSPISNASIQKLKLRFRKSRQS